MFNETFFHAEQAVFRASTGGAYNLIGAYGVMTKGTVFNTKGAMPIPTGKSGTIYSTGKGVRGNSTLFLSQMKPGDYIYAKDVVRRIDYIVSDTLLFLTQEFPTDIASGAPVIPLICEQQFYKSIYAKNTHASTSAVLQEAPMAPGQTFLNGGAPVSFDASGGGTIEFQLHK